MSKEIKGTIKKWKILSFCSRCGEKWCKLGKVLEYGKHYPAFSVKLKNGTKKEYPADDEIKEAVCSNCAKDLFDLEFILKKRG